MRGGEARAAQGSEGVFGSAGAPGRLASDGASPLCPIAANPPCPKCGRASIKRGRHKNGAQRYGCERCKIRFLAEYKDINREGNPNWKGDNITMDSGRDRARRWFPAPKGFDRHHVDGNPKNNDPSNVRIVTRKTHMLEDGRLEKRDPIRKCFAHSDKLGASL